MQLYSKMYRNFLINKPIYFILLFFVFLIKIFLTNRLLIKKFFIKIKLIINKFNNFITYHNYKISLISKINKKNTN